MLLARVPADARRVGLVGAAVTDHPKLPVILRALVDAGREVGISSLRADRLNDEIVGLLKRGGYRTLTTASDGASERLRTEIAAQDQREAPAARGRAVPAATGSTQLKLYMMLGLPGETMADIDELGRFSLELAPVAPRVVLGIAPFVAKRNTPLDRQAFTPIPELDARLARLRRLRGGPGRAAPHPPQVGLHRIPAGPGWVRRRPGGCCRRPGRAGATATGARPWPTCPSPSRCPPGRPAARPLPQPPPGCPRPAARDLTAGPGSRKTGRGRYF